MMLDNKNDEALPTAISVLRSERMGSWIRRELEKKSNPKVERGNFTLDLQSQIQNFTPGWSTSEKDALIDKVKPTFEGIPGCYLDKFLQPLK